MKWETRHTTPKQLHNWDPYSRPPPSWGSLSVPSSSAGFHTSFSSWYSHLLPWPLQQCFVVKVKWWNLSNLRPNRSLLPSLELWKIPWKLENFAQFGGYFQVKLSGQCLWKMTSYLYFRWLGRRWVGFKQLWYCLGGSPIWQGRLNSDIRPQRLRSSNSCIWRSCVT